MSLADDRKEVVEYSYISRLQATENVRYNGKMAPLAVSSHNWNGFGTTGARSTSNIESCSDKCSPPRPGMNTKPSLYLMIANPRAYVIRRGMLNRYEYCDT
jgi:hypothetical protein